MHGGFKKEMEERGRAGSSGREQVYAAEERKQKIIEWTVGLLLAVALSAVLGFIIYMIGLGNGSW